MNDKPITYYINKDLDSNKLVLNMINELLKYKYNNITFYCRNLGGYDAIFLFKVLNTYKDINKEDQYKMNHLKARIV